MQSVFPLQVRRDESFSQAAAAAVAAAEARNLGSA